jgi:poly-gamma-glutamate synthesis protein (capsule biosynthesis protein)
MGRLPGCTCQPTSGAIMGSDLRTLFMAGDVMLGRGIDQVQKASVEPTLHERAVQDARRYVELAEDASGSIPAPVDPSWVWGEALDALAEIAPCARLVNLETSITTSDEWWQGKGIHYRMHPDNVDVLAAADIDVCVLANNHVLDWGRTGLRETCDVLDDAGIGRCGAGAHAAEARAPARVGRGSAGVSVHAVAFSDAGVPPSWAATESRAGVSWYAEPTEAVADEMAERIRSSRRDNELVIVSAHWGGNWGYDVPPGQRQFARRLIDAGAADMIFGHSSHHPKGLEVYRGKPVLYGAGDLINDYEGIGGHEEFRPKLALAYFPSFDASGDVVALEARPFEVSQFRLHRAASEGVEWLASRLDRESAHFGTHVERGEGGSLVVRWE